MSYISSVLSIARVSGLGSRVGQLPQPEEVFRPLQVLIQRRQQ